VLPPTTSRSGAVIGRAAANGYDFLGYTKVVLWPAVPGYWFVAEVYNYNCSFPGADLGGLGSYGTHYDLLVYYGGQWHWYMHWWVVAQTAYNTSYAVPNDPC
jgi:hypothetical protein